MVSGWWKNSQCERTNSEYTPVEIKRSPDLFGRVLLTFFGFLPRVALKNLPFESFMLFNSSFFFLLFTREKLFVLSCV